MCEKSWLNCTSDTTDYKNNKEDEVNAFFPPKCPTLLTLKDWLSIQLQLCHSISSSNIIPNGLSFVVFSGCVSQTSINNLCVSMLVSTNNPDWWSEVVLIPK